MTGPKPDSDLARFILENKELKARLRESEETLEAIRNGEVDAIVVNGKCGEAVYSLQNAETPYRIILEEMNEAALIVSREGLILYCNKRFSEMLSIPAEKITCSKISSFIAAQDLDTFRILMQEGCARKTRGTVSFSSGEGRTIHTHLSVAALPRDLGGELSIIASDITDIRDHQDLLEEMVEKRSAELKKANEQLCDDVIELKKKEEIITAVARKYRILYDRMRESEDKYMDLVESANSIIMTTNTEGSVTFMNSYGLEFFGYKAEEIIGKNVIGTTIPVRDSAGCDLSLIVESIISDPRGFAINEHENLRKDGSLVWMSWSNKVTRDRKGNNTGILAIGNDISRFKMTQKALLESEEKFRKIIETASEGIIIVDLDGIITYVNPKMSDLLGYPQNDIIGHPGMEFMFESEKDKILQARKVINKSPFSGEVRFRRSNGSDLWTSCNATPVYDNIGKHMANLAMHTDITERKRTEDELFKSNELFRAVFECGAIAKALTSLSGELIRVNYAFCELTGYVESEMKELTFQQITHPDDLETNLDGFNRIITGESPVFRMEKRYIRKDGKTIWVDMSTVPVRDKHGKIEYMVTSIQDINERKRVESELKLFSEKLDMALETGHIGIWERNLGDDKVMWDTRMERIFDLEPGTFGGNLTAFEELINDEDLPHLRRCLAGSVDSGDMFETIFRTNPGRGDSKYISTRGIVNKDEKGHPLSLTGICFDVTGMKEGAEKDILMLNEELLRSNRELESFAYVASHDLQEPLRMVASFTQMLSQKYGDKLDQDAREYIKFAVDGAKRMYDLINGLLAYSRIHTKGREFSNVDMSSVFDKVTNNLGLIIGEKNVRISKEKLPVVFADESQMLQLVQNLLENAIKFSKRRPSIRFSAKDQDSCFVFTMKDNGIGIEPQYYEKIFRIFQQLMPKDEYAGTGIGLAICRRIVERHKGEIWVESVPGRGSSFCFTIPKK